ncbi:HNH endonuclease [Sphingobium sp. CFD-1]|uniref:HNH endonuclease n=1 Tax=Sphingobium sp. CFD-1 TaxID=2878545 RepID=UPI00214BBC1A|nr:HNH endonuclease [Sphingobium sp. CFD-1]
MDEARAACCWLCGRSLGRRVEWHHPLPKSRGGRDVVPLHPICHRTIHAVATNAELVRVYRDADRLRAHPAMTRFLDWIADKPPDFHAPTRRRH